MPSLYAPVAALAFCCHFAVTALASFGMIITTFRPAHPASYEKSTSRSAFRWRPVARVAVGLGAFPWRGGVPASLQAALFADPRMDALSFAHRPPAAVLTGVGANLERHTSDSPQGSTGPVSAPEPTER